jgi:CheY-like chemotaxis protein
MHVLVVDDNPQARDIMVQVCQSLGWHVEAADSGPQAIALTQSRAAAGSPFRAIFVDWHMPGMDGWQTSREIRASSPASKAEGAARTLIVMVTGHGRDMLAERSVREQTLLDGFLVKPVTASMLRDALSEAEVANITAATGRNPMAPQAVHKTQRLQGLRILVVEDNKINQMVAQGLLSAEGADITLADDGERGVEAVLTTQPPFDVVLMDVQMPVMDGYTATRNVRAQPGFQDLPIIAMTANAMASDRAACLAAGMNDHVGKPFDLDHLVATVLRFCGRSPASQTPSVVPSVAAPAGYPPGDLDLQGALSRLGGNEDLLADILKPFAQDLPQVPQRVAGLLSAGAAAELARALHTLKGLASTVGARHLAQVLAQLEQRSKDLPASADRSWMVDTLQSAVDATAASLKPVLASYESAAAGADGALAGQALQQPDVRADVQALAVLLENDDMQALEAYAALRTRHAEALGTALDPLDQAMASLEFVEALECCRALLVA